MKIEQASSPQTSKVSAGLVPKVSMFGAKFGFVIPKNKLSGSLVPSFRSTGKPGNTGQVNSKDKEKAVRRTKWGPDLTQDAFVRKARLLAYRTRLDQITQQIEWNDLGNEVGQDADMESLNSSKEFTHHKKDAEELEKLKLERREIIGEILKLNPSYKAPPDYVPVLKEARVPLPISDYPGYNFLGLMYGSGSDTLKQLEKETGAKIQVFGTRRDSAEKVAMVEITSDNKNDQDAYMELYTLISADTYDKVDAAVALVELLLTPVSVTASSSTLAVSNTPILGLSSEVPSEIPNAVVAGPAQKIIRPSQLFQDQFQYNVPASTPNNPAQLLSSQTNHGDIVPAVSSGPQISEPSPFPTAPQPHMQLPMQAYVSDSNTFHPADPPRHTPALAPPMFPSQPNLLNLHPINGSRPTPMGMSSLARPLGSAWPQPAPDNSFISQPNQDSSSTRWPIPSGPTQNSSMVAMTGIPVAGHQNTAFGIPQTASFRSRPSTVLSASNMNQGVVTNTSVAPPQMRSYFPSPQGPSAATMPAHSMSNFAVQSQLIRGPFTAASQYPAYRPRAASLPGPPASLPPLNESSFLPARPVIGIGPRMRFPSSGDFVFQPQHLQNSAALMNPRHGSQVQNHPPLERTMQKPLDIRTPFGIPDFPNEPPHTFFRGNFRPHADDLYDRFQPHSSEHNSLDVFSGPSFPFERYGMHDAAFSHMGGTGIIRPYPMANMHGPFLSRPRNDFFPSAHPGRNSLNIHPSSSQSFRPARGEQGYDPFSPTAASTVHPPQEAGCNTKLNDQEMGNAEC